MTKAQKGDELSPHGDGSNSEKKEFGKGEGGLSNMEKQRKSIESTNANWFRPNNKKKVRKRQCLHSNAELWVKNAYSKCKLTLGAKSWMLHRNIRRRRMGDCPSCNDRENKKAIE
jgi:hypothetical protein